MSPCDPDDDGAADYTRAITDQLRAWSGLEAICVDRIDVCGVSSSEAEPDLRGAYDATTRVITIDPEAPLRATTLHELCHAIDATSGFEVGALGPFVEEDVTERDVYPTRQQRVSEAFARVCEQGPVDVDRMRAWEGTCDTQPLDEIAWRQAAYVTKAVFRKAPTIPWSAPTFDVTPATPWDAPQDEAWRLVDAGSADGAIALLYRADAGPQLRVDHLTPTTGARQASWTLEPPSTGARLVPSSAGTWLLTTADPPRLWRLEPSAGGWVESTTPCDLVGEAVFVADGVIWTDTTDGPDVTIQRCDLASGETAPVEAPAAPFPVAQGNGWRTFSPRPTGDVWTNPTGGLAWQEGDEWRTAELPAYLSIQGVTVRSSDTLLTVVDRVYADALTTSVIQLDLDDGELRAPTRACVPSSPDGYQTLLDVGGVPVLSDPFLDELGAVHWRFTPLTTPD